MQHPLRIAFIGARGVAASYSGIETYYEEVGSRLAARGHIVTAYCRRHFTPPMDSYRGVRVRRLPSIATKHLDTISHSILCTLDTLRESYDIIQYHAIGSAPLSLLPRLWGKTTVLSVRGLDWQRAKWSGFARRCLQFGEWASARCPSATVVVSSTLQQHYTAQHGRTPHWIPNAVLPASPVAADRITRLGIGHEDFLLFAGRLSPEKGVDTLLEAIRPLDLRGKKVVLAGGSSYSDDYIRQLRASAGDQVLFIGSVDRATMEELYSNCYAYVLPSHMEGLSIGLLEALSYGACIVTTDIPENREVIGTAGLSFAPGDVTALRTHLDALLQDPTLVRRYRERAAAHALAKPDWDEVVRRTETFYYEILSGYPARIETGVDTSPSSRYHS